MKRTVFIFALISSLVVGVRAQSAPASVYAESFRQTGSQITEATFEARLSPQNPVYKQRIKDVRGGDRYVLSIVPRGPEGDNNVSFWQVKLQDLHHGIYDNILLTSQEPSSDPRSNLGFLDPGKYTRIPTSARRIIKVDSFYVVIEVKQYHFTPADSPYLDSMTVEVKFTNTDPREQGSP